MPGRPVWCPVTDSPGAPAGPLTAPSGTSGRRGRSARLAELVRFGIVGVANTVVYYACYLLLLQVLPYLVAHLLAWAVSFVASFLLNCRFTYRVRPTWRRFLLFPLSTLANVGMTTFGVVAMVSWLGVDERIAPLIAGILAIPATFLVTRYLLVGRESRGA